MRRVPSLLMAGGIGAGVFIGGEAMVDQIHEETAAAYTQDIINCAAHLGQTKTTSPNLPEDCQNIGPTFAYSVTEVDTYKGEDGSQDDDNFVNSHTRTIFILPAMGQFLHDNLKTSVVDETVSIGKNFHRDMNRLVGVLAIVCGGISYITSTDKTRRRRTRPSGPNSGIESTPIEPK